LSLKRQDWVEGSLWWPLPLFPKEKAGLAAGLSNSDGRGGFGHGDSPSVRLQQATEKKVPTKNQFLFAAMHFFE
jgi:hypothetical protein